MTTIGSTTPTSASVTALTNTLLRGVAGGLVGGVVFGMLMQMMGMLPMVAALVGGSSTALGWVVHLSISGLLGGVFALAASRWASSLAVVVGLGAAYGMVWWVFGALVLMPAKLGMDLFMINDVTMKSLMGHVIYGVLTGAVVGLLAQRSIT